MEKVGGRPRDEEVWKRVTQLEGGRRVKCNDCGYEFSASAHRIKAHIDKVKGKGIRVCTGKANSNNDLEENLLRSLGQIQADDTEDQERIQVGSSFVSNGENVDSQRSETIDMDYIVEDLGSTEEFELPGFRFHPTDEELVGFYLKRKLDKKPIRMDLIKQIDIYKYDPWDLPQASCSGGEKEWFFFCRRGRKYKNSIRPNKVTGSGFWKATGIEKPVYSLAGEGTDRIIGLKKTLAYYRGFAGKGTKTEWMMHEFRLPSNNNHPSNNNPQEAEIWTLCRIFKRTVTQRKCTPDWTRLAAKRHSSDKISSRLMSNNNSTVDESCNSSIIYDQEAYINFEPFHVSHFSSTSMVAQHQQPHQSPSSALSFWGNNQQDSNNDLFAFENSSWDELESVVQLWP